MDIKRILKIVFTINGLLILMRRHKSKSTEKSGMKLKMLLAKRFHSRDTEKVNTFTVSKFQNLNFLCRILNSDTCLSTLLKLSYESLR